MTSAATRTGDRPVTLQEISRKPPPIAGVISAVVGGLVTTFFRGSHIAINGPANSLIVVIAAGISVLKDGADSASAMPYVAAAVMIVGFLQVVLGLLRVGSLAAYVPSSVIYGMLAAIGVVICAKQAHVALGWHSRASSGLGDISSLPDNLAHMNPLVTFIAVVSLLILLLHPRLKSFSMHYIPAPLLVLCFAIPMGYLFDFRKNHFLTLLGHTMEINERYHPWRSDPLVELLPRTDPVNFSGWAFWSDP